VGERVTTAFAGGGLGGDFGGDFGEDLGSGGAFALVDFGGGDTIAPGIGGSGGVDFGRVEEVDFGGIGEVGFGGVGFGGDFEGVGFGGDFELCVLLLLVTVAGMF
jgi:hypothetical protein